MPDVETILERYYDRVLSDFLSYGLSARTLYHYTTAKSLTSIVSTNTFRASNVRFMNDQSELTYGVDLLRSVVDTCINKAKPSIGQGALDFFRSHVIPKLNERSQRQFVLSFSFNEDSLHLWNYYGRSDGYAIGTNLYDLVRSFQSKEFLLRNTTDFDYKDFSLYYGKVLYDPKAQRDFLELSVLTLAEIYELETKCETATSLKHVADKRIELTHYLNASVYNVKSTPHSIEDEYRITLIPNTDFRGVRYEPRNGLIVPLVEIGGNLLPVEEIVIGPMIHDAMAEMGLRGFLGSLGRNGTKVTRSRLTLR